MDFRELYNKIRSIDTAESSTTEHASMPTNEMPVMAPPMAKDDTPPPSMSVNLNAQGMDNIESMMKLFTKVNPDMMPQTDMKMPSMTSPMLKLPVDVDGQDNDPGASADDEDEFHKDLDNLTHKTFGPSSDEKEMGQDDDEKEKEEAWDNEPDEEYDDMSASIPAGDDMHKKKKGYPAVNGGDNPRAVESKDLRGKIKEELWKALSEAKKEDQTTTEGRGRGNKKKMEDQTTTEGRGKGKGRGRGKG